MISFKISIAIVFCLLSKCFGNSENQLANSAISIEASSAIFLSCNLKNKASFLSREPLQTGQSISSINSFAHLFMEEELLSSYWFLMNFEIPSKSILYSLVTPAVLETMANFSLPPFRIISIASSDIFSIGSVSLKPYFSPIISNCLNIQELLYSPKGIIPPLFIDILVLGMIFFLLICWMVPNPLQSSQAPFGELNENKLGSGFWYEMPEVGHIKVRLKKRTALDSCSITIKTSSP